MALENKNVLNNFSCLYELYLLKLQNLEVLKNIKKIKIFSQRYLVNISRYIFPVFFPEPVDRHMYIQVLRIETM